MATHLQRHHPRQTPSDGASLASNLTESPVIYKPVADVPYASRVTETRKCKILVESSRNLVTLPRTDPKKG